MSKPTDPGFSRKNSISNTLSQGSGPVTLYSDLGSENTNLRIPRFRKGLGSYLLICERETILIVGSGPEPATWTIERVILRSRT